MSAYSKGAIRVAVLHQAIDPPVIGGVRKAKKPGGYKDSSADIAYVLRRHAEKTSIPPEVPHIQVIAPVRSPDPTKDEEWSFPDAEIGILSAIQEHGANHIWGNTVFFSNHPLQQCKALDYLAEDVYIVGQPPQLVEKYDDKNWVNEKLKQDPRLNLPRAWTVNLEDIVSSSATTDQKIKTLDDITQHLSTLNLPFPVVGKPVRGRGSHGVKLCHDLAQLASHLHVILHESPHIMIEEFLAGQEGTVTVMPPSQSGSGKHWSLPLVERFNHDDGVAPYNGVVAVIANSRVVPLDVQAYTVGDGVRTECSSLEVNTSNLSVDTIDTDNAYVDIRRQCEMVAEKMGCTAPMRIDVRRRKQAKPEGSEGNAKENPFVMFDVNMKPNMTGPGRPGREDQASLTAMAAEALGWDYARLLQEILKTAQPLRQVRAAKLPDGWE